MNACYADLVRRAAKNVSEAYGVGPVSVWDNAGTVTASFSPGDWAGNIWFTEEYDHGGSIACSWSWDGDVFPLTDPEIDEVKILDWMEKQMAKVVEELIEEDASLGDDGTGVPAAGRLAVGRNNLR